MGKEKSPKWDYRPPPANPESWPLPKELISAVREILADVESDSLRQFLGALTCCITLYVVDKRRAQKGQEKPPTGKEIELAAKALQTDCLTLAERLQGETGGLKPYLYPGLKEFGRRGYREFCEETAGRLQRIAEAAAIALDQGIFNLPPARTKSPETEFAEMVAWHYQLALNEKPSGTYPESEPEKASKYARILAACLHSVTGKMPTDNSLHRLVQKGVKDLPPLGETKFSVRGTVSGRK